MAYNMQIKTNKDGMAEHIQRVVDMDTYSSAMINTNQLKGRMAAAGYTQRKLANAMGINKNTLNAKVNGTRSFDTKEIVRICELLHIQAAEEKCSIFCQDRPQKMGLI
ncbi:MAG: helix-turn-helix transcriptional regulator [Eubacteriales bacterium]|nr:helix-turn-helix transcriptional regulator [Eubacteriales bacterium]